MRHYERRIFPLNPKKLFNNNALLSQKLTDAKTDAAHYFHILIPVNPYPVGIGCSHQYPFGTGKNPDNFLGAKGKKLVYFL